MEKSSSHPVFVLPEPEKPSLWKRALTYIGVIGGGLLGAHYGLKSVAGHVDKDIDITRPGSWESGQVDEVPVAAQDNVNHEVDAVLKKASGASVDRAASAKNEADSLLERIMQHDKPDAKLAADAVEGPKRRADIQPESVIEPSYSERPVSPKSGKPAPKVVSAGTAKRLMGLMDIDPEEVHGIERVSIHKSPEGTLSAKLHIGSKHIHIPEISPLPDVPGLGMGSKYLKAGEVRSLTPQAHVVATQVIIPDALRRREAALLSEQGGTLKTTWGALRKLDGMGKFNVAGTALMGVILGGFVADIAKTVVSGIAHLGTATPREPGKHI